jgi:hypothetical protein
MTENTQILSDKQVDRILFPYRIAMGKDFDWNCYNAHEQFWELTVYHAVFGHFARIRLNKVKDEKTFDTLYEKILAAYKEYEEAVVD